MAADTHAQADAIQLDFFRRLSTEERLRLAGEMSDSLRRVALDGLRSRRPELSQEELKFELMRLMYGFVAQP